MGSSQEATLTFNCDSLYIYIYVQSSASRHPSRNIRILSKTGTAKLYDVAAGNDREAEDMETSKFLDLSKEGCRQLGATEPDTSDSVLKERTFGITSYSHDHQPLYASYTLVALFFGVVHVYGIRVGASKNNSTSANSADAYDTTKLRRSDSENHHVYWYSNIPWLLL